MGHLRLLALIEGDGLGVVPNMHQGITEVGLVAQLVEVQADQAPADQDGEHRPHEGIAEHHHHQQDRLGPEDPREGDKIHHGTQNNEQEGERGPGERADVFHDPLVGVVDLGARFDLIVVSVFEIASEKGIGHPFPPFHAEVVLDVAVEGDNGDPDEKTAEVDGNEEIGKAFVFFHQGVGEVISDIAERDIDAGDG